MLGNLDLASLKELFSGFPEVEAEDAPKTPRKPPAAAKENAPANGNGNGNRPYTKMTVKIARQIIRLHERKRNPMSANAIAKEIGVSYGVVRKVIEGTHAICKEIG